WPRTLLQHDVQVVRHDRIRDQTRVAADESFLDHARHHGLQSDEQFLAALDPGRYVEWHAWELGTMISRHTPRLLEVWGASMVCWDQSEPGTRVRGVRGVRLAASGAFLLS